MSSADSPSAMVNTGHRHKHISTHGPSAIFSCLLIGNYPHRQLFCRPVTITVSCRSTFYRSGIRVQKQRQQIGVTPSLKILLTFYRSREAIQDAPSSRSPSAWWTSQKHSTTLAPASTLYLGYSMKNSLHILY